MKLKTNKFTFYVPHHNEDADPFICTDEKSGLLVVADGLGGSGSTVHQLSPEAYDALEAKLRAAFLTEFEALMAPPKEAPAETAPAETAPAASADADEASGEGSAPAASDETQESGEKSPIIAKPSVTEVKEMMDKPWMKQPASEGAPAATPAPEAEAEPETVALPDWIPGYKEWIEKLLVPMADETPDTSALWASRIVISRFVYYMIKHGNEFIQNKDTEGIVSFINEGLKRVKQEFALKAGALSGQSVLPTTLVALQYNVEDKQAECEVFWAGDSRAYAMFPGKGLRQLSKDHEDNSGAINRLFGFRGNEDEPRKPECEIRSNMFELPCAFFVCSDGIFDPFAPVDSLGVERALLDALENADSFEAYGKNLEEYYKIIRQDDCTMAFVALGFDNFNSFKKAFMPKADRVRKLHEDFKKYKAFFSVIDGESDKPDLLIRNRANQRKAEILKMVAAATWESAAGLTTDPIVTEEMKGMYRIACEEDKERRVKEKELEICNAIREVLKMRKAATIFEKVPADGPWAMCDAANRAIIIAEEAVAKAREKEEIVRNVLSDHEDTAKEYLEAIDNKINADRDRLNNVLNPRKSKYEKVKTLCTTAISELEQAGNILKEIDEAKNKQLIGEYASLKEKSANIKITIDRNVDGVIKEIAALEKEINHLKALKIWWASKTIDGNCSENIEPYTTNIRHLVRGYNEATENLHAAEDDTQKAEATLSSSEQTYVNAVDSVKDEDLLEIIRNPQGYLTGAFMQQWGLPIKLEVKEISAEEFEPTIIALYSDEEKYETLITAFLKLTQPSCLEKWFNASQLSKARSYAVVDMEEVKKAKDDVAAILDEYEEEISENA
ncbi:MAG: hypothetical protein IJU10_01320 [Clostridia bacterium]|nr:hypothetical protein [Clostridia bacterium]